MDGGVSTPTPTRVVARRAAVATTAPIDDAIEAAQNFALARIHALTRLYDRGQDWNFQVAGRFWQHQRSARHRLESVDAARAVFTWSDAEIAEIATLMAVLADAERHDAAEALGGAVCVAMKHIRAAVRQSCVQTTAATDDVDDGVDGDARRGDVTAAAQLRYAHNRNRFTMVGGTAPPAWFTSTTSPTELLMRTGAASTSAEAEFIAVACTSMVRAITELRRFESRHPGAARDFQRRREMPAPPPPAVRRLQPTAPRAPRDPRGQVDDDDDDDDDDDGGGDDGVADLTHIAFRPPAADVDAPPPRRVVTVADDDAVGGPRVRRRAPPRPESDAAIDDDAAFDAAAAAATGTATAEALPPRPPGFQVSDQDFEQLSTYAADDDDGAAFTDLRQRFGAMFHWTPKVRTRRADVTRGRRLFPPTPKRAAATPASSWSAGGASVVASEAAANACDARFRSNDAIVVAFYRDVRNHAKLDAQIATLERDLDMSVDCDAATILRRAEELDLDDRDAPSSSARGSDLAERLRRLIAIRNEVRVLAKADGAQHTPPSAPVS